MTAPLSVLAERLRTLADDHDHDEDCAAWVSGVSTDVVEEKCDCSKVTLREAADALAAQGITLRQKDALIEANRLGKIVGFEVEGDGTHLMDPDDDMLNWRDRLAAAEQTIERQRKVLEGTEKK